MPSRAKCFNGLAKQAAECRVCPNLADQSAVLSSGNGSLTAQVVFVAEARRVSLELAADYLVMAAWLAYLKSRLLLPEPETDEDEPTAPELAEALKFQLRRIESMQQAGVFRTCSQELGTRAKNCLCTIKWNTVNEVD